MGHAYQFRGLISESRCGRRFHYAGIPFRHFPSQCRQPTSVKSFAKVWDRSGASGLWGLGFTV